MKYRGYIFIMSKSPTAAELAPAELTRQSSVNDESKFPEEVLHESTQTVTTATNAASTIEIPIMGSQQPTYSTTGSAGVDLRAAIKDPVILYPGSQAIIPTGIRTAIPVGYEVQIRPRSGLAANHGVTVLNSPGTIDSDYRGDWGVILINHGAIPFTVTPGMRIAQMVVAEVIQARWKPVDSLDETERGSGGFGSTGTK
jgi:dUTP pyrophosphatase